MWIFSSPQNYSEMLKKIATTMLFISLFIIMGLSHLSTDLGDFMKLISFGITYENSGISFYISYLYFPLIFAVVENTFKLHNIISDIFGIRFRFDRNLIIFTFLKKVGLSEKFEKVNKSNRDELMTNIFYKYASSTSPQIDRHFIDMALNAWSWYWIFLDTVVCIFILGLFGLIYSFSWKFLIILVKIIASLLVIMFLIKKFQCHKYALQEVDAIVESQNRKNAIKEYLCHAL